MILPLHFHPFKELSATEVSEVAESTRSELTPVDANCYFQSTLTFPKLDVARSTPVLGSVFSDRLGDRKSESDNGKTVTKRLALNLFMAN